MKFPSKLSGQQIGTGIACIFLLGITGAFAILNSLATDAFNDEYSANMRQLNELGLELSTIVDADVTEKATTADLSSAAELGQKVADYQMEYQETYATMMTDHSRIAESLRECFTSGSSNAAVAWFLPEHLTDTGEYEIYKWKFETTYSFSGVSVPVLWTCWDDKGELLAYTTGTYSVKDLKFSDITRYTTSVGDDLISPTIDDDVTGSEASGQFENNGLSEEDANALIDSVLNSNQDTDGADENSDVTAEQNSNLSNTETSVLTDDDASAAGDVNTEGE